MPLLESSPEKPHVFDPVWECIYCGWNADPERLSKEHVIPYGLDGAIILPRASCPKCSEITRDFETVCLKNMLKQFRTHTKLRSRKGNFPEVLAIRATRDGQRRNELVPVKDHPLILVLPVFEPPGILIGRDPFLNIQKGGAMIWRDDEEFARRLKLHGDQDADVAVPQLVDPQAFGKMLAKIGHSFAVGMFGQQVFRPFLKDAILNTRTNYTNWVGGAHKDIQGDGLHLIDTREGMSRLGQRLLSVAIRLFQAYGMPTYEVIVGEIISGRDHDLLNPRGLKAPQHNSGRIPSGPR